MASGMVSSERSALPAQKFGEPGRDLGLHLRQFELVQFMAARCAGRSRHHDIAARDVAVEPQGMALGGALGVDGQDDRGARFGQLVGHVGIFLRRDMRVVALALQIVDREVELRPYRLPAFDPKGLHEQVGVAIHFPLHDFHRLVRAILASPGGSNLPPQISPSDFPRRRRELFDQEAHEGRDLGGKVPAVRIDSVDRHRLLGREIAEQRHQRAVADGPGQGEPRQARNADAVQGELHLQLAFAHGDPAADLDLDDLSVDLERPAVEVGAFARHDAIVPRQLLGPTRRAVACEIGRRGADQAFVLADLARHEARIAQPSDANGDVDAFLDKVDHPVGRQQVELHQRIARQELRQHRGELVGGEGQRRRHAQYAVRRAAVAGDLRLERLDLAHDALGTGVENLALLGEVQRPRRALQESHAKPGLEPRDELADRRWCQPEARRGGGKALEIDDPHEGGHFARVIDHCGISELHS